MKTITYPEIYSSENVIRILSKKPQLPQAPIEPVKPIMPSDPGEYDSGGNRGCSLFVVIAGVIIFFVVMSSDKEHKVSIILPLIGIIALSFFMFKTTTWDKESHEQKRKNYENIKRNFSLLMESYNKNLTVYQEAKNRYDIIVRQLQSEQNISKYRKELISAWINNRVNPYFECGESIDVKRGVSEDFFYNLLCEVFSDMHNNACVPVGKSFYYPDFLIYEKGLLIDIEIDEPYAGNDGTAIHYVDNKYGICTSIDEERNDYFTSHGFEVIRFSEEQIFLHTQECINVINKYVSSVLSGCKPKIEQKNFVLEKWTKDQASKWAYQRFRNTYVPVELQSSITNEGIKTYDELRYGND